jgi:Lar family restriction alleviation protein
MDETKLLPCPFCGRDVSGYPRIMILEKRRMMPDLLSVKCPWCSAQAPVMWSEEEAIAAWNRRGKIKEADHG